MHVLVITPGFPKDENDTDCIPPMQEYFEALLESHTDVEVSVIAIHYPEKKINYDWKKLRVFAIGGNRKNQPLRSIYWLAAIWKALKINSKNKIDIVHSFWLNESALIGENVSRLLKVKHINTMMGQDAKKENKFIKILPLKKIIKVAVSDFQSKIFKSSANIEVDAVIPWGIKPFLVEEKERNIDIIGVGSLIEVKNFKLFIEVIRELKKDFKDINCLLVGDGYLRGELMNKIDSYELSRNIKLTGQLPREEVVKLMKRSKILLHTSDYESFGYVLEEGVVAGCYVVSRRVGCAEESDKFFVADNDMDFGRIVKKILSEGKDYSARILFPVCESVEFYLQLYEKFSREVAKPQNLD